MSSVESLRCTYNAENVLHFQMYIIHIQNDFVNTIYLILKFNKS